MQISNISENKITFHQFQTTVLEHYTVALQSREVSLLGRKEVLTGKAKFGIFGDGKELPQIAMASVFKNGDFRSGYYRDQTFMMAIGQLSIDAFFAQLYALTDIKIETASAGRQMTSHFGTKLINEDGSWLRLTNQKNSSADISPTAGQMPRLLGLAQASKIYRELDLDKEENFSVNGNEIAFGTIGDASTSEGHFWEVINAAGVLQVPMILSIWDDEYGISVPSKIQRTKNNLSEMLSGFQRSEEQRGFQIISTKAWDYMDLMNSYAKAEELARKFHIPVIVHVQECTQPQGHSTSGSHERYKSQERLEWEKEYDGIKKFREWILHYNVEGQTIATEQELIQIETQTKQRVKEAQKRTWDNYLTPILKIKEQAIQKLNVLLHSNLDLEELKPEINQLDKKKIPFKKDVYALVRKAIRMSRHQDSPQKSNLIDWYKKQNQIEQEIYSSKLYSNSAQQVQKIQHVPIQYPENPEKVDGRIVLRDNFEALFNQHQNLVTFGEDSGKIGDVNQGLEGLQSKFGNHRVADTGIREASIVGQGIGLAMRGLRPIAEIQYLDYVLYGLQTMSDDLATVLYRSAGQQKAPTIIRTRGHRLEGIWHAGSPLGGIINLVRGINVLVPRNLTKAAGFYNALLQSDEPALVIESLNGYRLKENLPSNLGIFTTPIGKVEVTKEGKDVTILTYGSTWRIVTQAAQELEKININAEVIDAQSLLPFDLNQDTLKSIQKTNRLVVVDEDVPGGASAYLLQQVLEEQAAYLYLDSQPITITAKAHRPAYASDGDYFSKPSVDDVVEQTYAIFNEFNPTQYPTLF